MLKQEKEFKLFNENQHGFMKGKWCLTKTNLLETLKDIISSLGKGDAADVIFLDKMRSIQYPTADC